MQFLLVFFIYGKYKKKDKNIPIQFFSVFLTDLDGRITLQLIEYSYVLVAQIKTVGSKVEFFLNYDQ